MDMSYSDLLEASSEGRYKRADGSRNSSAFGTII